MHSCIHCGAEDNGDISLILNTGCQQAPESIDIMLHHPQ
jgi:hypothetical protein